VESTSHRDLGLRLALHTPRLRLLIAHLAGSAVRRHLDVDDLVQEVLVRTLFAPDSIPPATAVQGDALEPALWRLLAQIARHTVIDAARALRAQKRSGAVDAVRFSNSSAHGPRASQFVLDATGPATAALKRETTLDLVKSYGRLTAEHRRVLGLRQFEGLSAAEAARRMGRSEPAIHSLYRRALDAWAVELGGDPLP
jgi:RNA polymerase sigma factor (sigma-70 family)